MYCHKGLVRAAAVALYIAGALHAGPCAADPLFDRPVRVVVPFSAGGTVDVAARAVANALEKKTGQAMVVDNKPGAGGNIAASAVAHAPASQPMLLVTMVNHFVNPVIFKNPGYDVAKDFIPIMQLGTSPYVFVVKGNSRFNSLKELAAYAREKPGHMAWGFGGIGSPGQFFGIEFARAAKVQTNPISYRGGPDLLAAIAGDQLDMVVMSAETSLPMIRDGRLKALAATGESRNTALPEVPTATEQIAGYEPLTGYTMLLAATTIPRDKLVKLHKDVVEVVLGPDYQASLKKVGATVATTQTLEESQAFFDKEGDRWRAIAKASGLQVQ
jgi:tripartite-type tricarboxylate transporter receptor subunit TctC